MIISRQKLAEVLNSRNALVSFLTILLLAIEAQGISIGESAQTILDSFANKEVSAALVVFFLNFLTPISKLVQKIVAREWSWDFLRSENFQAQVATMLTMFLLSFFKNDTAIILSGLIIQALNFIFHLIAPAKVEPEIEPVTEPEITDAKLPE